MPFRRDAEDLTTSGIGVSVWTGGEYQYPLGDGVRLRAGANLSRRDYAGSRFDQTFVSGHAGPRWLVGRNTEASVQRRWSAGAPDYDALGARAEAGHRFTRRVKASSDSVLTAKQDGYTMSAAPEEIAGWRGRKLENDGDTTVTYTNIEDAEAKTIGLIYDSASSFGEPDLYYDVVDAVEPGTETEHDIPWSVVKRDDEDSTTTGSGATATTTFAGSVSGLAGTFSCTGADCEAPTGDALSSTQMWTFVPDDANGTIDVPDEAYVSFGWWLNAMGTMGAYDFDAFASVVGMDARSVVPGQVEGSATYKGGAAGKWAMRSTSDDSASGGHFTAAATLTANFDANTDTTGNTRPMASS